MSSFSFSFPFSPLSLSGCGHCKHIAPIWEELATDLRYSTINIAKVDCTINKLTARRFAIRGFPTIKLIHDGRMYQYSGARSLESFKEFAEGGFKSSISQDLPSPPSFMSMMLRNLGQLIKSVQTIFMKRPVAGAVVFSLGTMFGGIFCMAIMVCYSNERALMNRIRQLKKIIKDNEAKKEQEAGQEEEEEEVEEGEVEEEGELVEAEEIPETPSPGAGVKEE